LPQVGPGQEEREAWIDRALERLPTAERLTYIVDRRRGANELWPFQKAVGASTARATFVRAGCGTGKTLAAYHWAARQHPNRRLYFCYPTTGTATEGYRDYLFAPGEDEDTDLFHGRAAVDLEAILAIEERNEDELPGVGGDELIRIGSLDAWSTPIVSCTTDVVLGLVQNHRRGMYGWPALAGAAFIFDEIHSYDDRLFGALLRFLQALPGLPVLLMTASLPAARLQALQKCLAECGEELPVIEGPRDLEELPRYHREDVAEADLVGRVERELAADGKVLWVCNTVGRVMEAAERFRSIHPFIYHSRFRYEDRVARHCEVVAAFRPENRAPALAICSQVAEMSLDLSATLLITDLAPVSALIQRLGRLNRWARSGAPTRPFVVVRPESPLPYEQVELDEAERWLSRLAAEGLTQIDLARTWAAGEESGWVDGVESTWLDGGPSTTVGELREASPGLTVVLKRDVPSLDRRRARLRAARQEAARRGVPLDEATLRLREGEKDLVQVALPMPPAPRRVSWRAWKRFQHTLIAPEGTINYDPLRGGEWR
jgi:CRISPR-associated endonuclease/helicase Cas3